MACEDEANTRKLNCRFTLFGGISPSVNWDLRFIRSSRDHDTSSVIAALAFYPTDLCQGEKQIHFSFAFHLCCFHQRAINLNMYSQGAISLSLDSVVCQFVRFFKVIHDQYWKKIVLYIPVSELRLIYSCKIEQTLWSQ